ncbi:tripartite tricarboxylate transporter substrate-binding protein [Sabulicella glaciei]|uniref:Tripartite tricarboxylate transporter substrate-binding protein n=1 Tax=Sabulicella glaciei TaxID=2984948 RepID=A0ABT3NPB7_9PROT|nr:tripartite tricarboxylate transporter substrate-binding protein [Roseococcus sp. MDT2-1-1]MCW8084012.1 tripartite tricarboxylate transporter substrate-binding protein [Roseococcus sp. MDT2-1-1]
MAEALYPQCSYRIDADFVPVAITAVVPNVLVVNPASGLTDVRMLMDRARAAPGPMSYCSSGSGTSQHIIAEMFLCETGLRMLHIPHRGTAPAMNDLFAGVCPMMFPGMGTSAPQIQGQRLNPLTLTVSRRFVPFPQSRNVTEGRAALHRLGGAPRELFARGNPVLEYVGDQAGFAGGAR